MSITQTGSLHVPKITKASHRYATLSSGVTVIAIEDPSADMPAAAMSIGVGSLCDPPEFPGLAHFCEHMLFMGTEKFPGEDEYDKYVTTHGGHSNAWTADTCTSYYFTVSSDALAGALERFVEFFASPMFKESCVEREVQAVHSEDEKNHSVDYWRLDEIFRTMYNPDHPRFRYGNGNAKTLWDEPRKKGLNVRDALLKFYGEYYVASAACLAVYSKHSLEEIVQIVQPSLLRMRSGAPRATFSYLPSAASPFAASAFGNVYCVKSVKKTISVRVVWSLKQSIESRNWSMPSSYASHVLGHECNASVLGVLKAESLAVAMTCGARGGIDDDFDFFYADISLTKKGFKQVLRVVDVLYQGIALLRQRGSADDGVYAEMIQEEVLNFELDDMAPPPTHCAALSGSALRYGPEEAWAGGRVIAKEDKAAAFDVIRRDLVPSNSFLVFMWSEFQANESPETGSKETKTETETEQDEEDEEGEDEESGEAQGDDEKITAAMLPAFFETQTWSTAPIHGARYTTNSIPAEVVSRWQGILDGTEHDTESKDKLRLPPRNPFISTDFTVFESNGSADDPPTRVDTRFGTFFIKADAGRHRAPKTGVKIETVSAVPYATPLHRFFTRVAVLVLKDALTEMLYFAELAAIANDIGPSEGGFGIAVEGPSQKVFEMCRSLLERCFSRSLLIPSGEKFASYCDLAVRSLESARTSQPYEIAASLVRHHVSLVNYTFDEVLDAVRAPLANGKMEGHSLARYTEFVDLFLGSPVKLEGTVFGNISSVKDVERDFCDALSSTLEACNIAPFTEISAAAIPRYRDTLHPVATVADDSWLLSDHDAYNPADPNTAVIATFVAGQETPELRAASDAFQKLVKSEFFNALRTTESIGYVVSTSSQRIGYSAFVRFIVQSAVPSMDAQYLLTRIIAFIDHIEAVLLPSWTPAQLDDVKQALILQRMDPPKSIREELMRLDDEMLHPSQFQRKALEIAAIKKMELADVKKFFFDTCANRSPAALTAAPKCRIAVVVRRSSSSPIFADGKDDAEFETRSLIRQNDLTAAIKIPTFEEDNSKRTIHLRRFSRKLHGVEEGTTVKHPSF